MKDQDYMKIAYDQALLARDNDEVPIGAIIVKDDQIIASAFNKKELQNDVTAHAEMLAIREACQTLQTWHLEDCTLYTTLEPCIMCTGAIIQSRMKRVVFGARGQRWNGLTQYISQHDFNHYPDISGDILGTECSQLITNYFSDKRRK